MDFYKDIELKESTYRKFVDFIYRHSGIDLGHNKQVLVKTRFQKRLHKLGLDSFESYYDLVVRNNDQEELVSMIDAISTNHTFFYREKDHFDYLSSKALPAITATKKQQGNRKLRAWCAASSSGEEPYTIMICILEHLGAVSGWDLKMLATDISTKVLDKAKRGIYDHDRVRTVPPALLAKYFRKEVVDGEKEFHVNDHLKSQIYFRRMNLMMPRFPFKGTFDFIFNRNVMIYFDRPTQDQLIEKMIAFLEPNGYLFVGHSETVSPKFKGRLKMLGPALYQKVSS